MSGIGAQQQFTDSGGGQIQARNKIGVAGGYLIWSRIMTGRTRLAGEGQGVRDSG